jgi:hypothetical protein
MRRDPVAGPVFLDVYAADTLPQKVPSRRPLTLIVNTDNLIGEGKHWIGIFLPKHGPIEFFDSLGRPPGHYNPTFLSFLKRVQRFHTYNTKRMQAHDSSVCGIYVLYYLIHRSRGIPMSTITLLFTRNLDNNDKLVTRWFHDYVAY